MFSQGNNRQKIMFIRIDFWESKKFVHPMHFVPPITLKYASSLLNKDGRYDVEIIDCCVDKISINELVSRIVQQLPLAVVISSSSFSIKKSWDFAAEVKNHNNQIFIIGTGHAFVSEPKEYLSSDGPFDIILTGEVEQEIYEVVRMLNEMGKSDEIKELYRKRWINHSPVIVYELDDLPFPNYSLEELKKYIFIYPIRLNKKVLCGYILSSRGCKYSCIFCTQAVRKSYAQKIRCRAAFNIVDEIEKLINVKVNLIYFMDDNFSASREHVVSICKEIMRRKLKIHWVASPRIDELDYDLLEIMKKAGCILLLLSVESGSLRVIELLNKTPDPDGWLKKAKDVFNNTKKVGIGTCALFIIGSPSETEDDVEKSIELAKGLDPDYIKVHFFTPYPGTAIYEEVSKSLPIENLDSMHHYLIPVINLSAMSTEKLRTIQAHFYKKFLFRPNYIFRHLTKFLLFYIYNPNVFKILCSFVFRTIRSCFRKK